MIAESKKVDTYSELAEYCREREIVYTLLGSLVHYEINTDSAEALKQLALSIQNPQDDLEKRAYKSAQIIKNKLVNFNDALEDELAVEFARVFLSAGLTPSDEKTSAPYESVYTSESGLMCQEARDQVRQIFRDEGIMPEINEYGGDIPEDFLAFELYYMGILSKKCAEALDDNDLNAYQNNLDKQSFFINQHLLNWIEDYHAAVESVARQDFYIALVDFIQAFLLMDKDAISSLKVEK